MVDIPCTNVRIPIWVTIAWGYVCTLILVLGFLIAWLLYRFGQWLHSQYKKCKGKKKKHWWQKLLCFLIAVLEWIVYITAIAVIIAAIILMIYCIIWLHA